MENFYFLAGVVFLVVFVTFAGLAAGAVAFFAVPSFFDFTAFAARICFLRLSCSNLDFIAGAHFGNLICERKVFS